MPEVKISKEEFEAADGNPDKMPSIQNAIAGIREEKAADAAGGSELGLYLELDGVKFYKPSPMQKWAIARFADVDNTDTDAVMQVKMLIGAYILSLLGEAVDSVYADSKVYVAPVSKAPEGYVIVPSPSDIKPISLLEVKAVKFASQFDPEELSDVVVQLVMPEEDAAEDAEKKTLTPNGGQS